MNTQELLRNCKNIIEVTAKAFNLNCGQIDDTLIEIEKRLADSYRAHIDWTNIEDGKPEEGRNVIAVGQWYGEIHGHGETDYMGLGEWRGDSVHIASDAYSTQIINITKWVYIPEHP